jgi:hypothetical protein
MRRAGDDNGNNYDLVYSGGLIASLALDVELRRNTKNVSVNLSHDANAYRPVNSAFDSFL